MSSEVPNFATVSACASSNHALIDAYNYIRLGMADAIVAGGAESSGFPRRSRWLQFHEGTLYP